MSHPDATKDYSDDRDEDDNGSLDTEEAESDEQEE